MTQPQTHYALIDDYNNTGCHECGTPITAGSTYCWRCLAKHREALREREEMLSKEAAELERREPLHEALSTIFLLATKPDMTLSKAMDRVAEVAERALDEYEATL